MGKYQRQVKHTIYKDLISVVVKQRVGGKKCTDTKYRTAELNWGTS